MQVLLQCAAAHCYLPEQGGQGRAWALWQEGKAAPSLVHSQGYSTFLWCQLELAYGFLTRIVYDLLQDGFWPLSIF